MSETNPEFTLNSRMPDRPNPSQPSKKARGRGKGDKYETTKEKAPGGCFTEGRRDTNKKIKGSA